MENILKKYNLDIKIDKEENELVIVQGKSDIFLETDISAEYHELINKGDLKSVIIDCLKVQLESDFDCVIEESNTEESVTSSVLIYMRECFEIYNSLLNL